MVIEYREVLTEEVKEATHSQERETMVVEAVAVPRIFRCHPVF
jgi:hypothetical protein